MKIIEFRTHDMKPWGDKQQEISDQLKQCLESGKGFSVEFNEIENLKTHEQLKAIYKLLQKSKPHFDNWRKQKHSLKEIKQYVKVELDFMDEPNDFEIKLMIKGTGFVGKAPEERKRIYNFCKRIKQPKSFSIATKNELINFIEAFQAWALTPDPEKKKTAWLDVFLEEQEKELLT